MKMYFLWLFLPFSISLTGQTVERGLAAFYADYLQGKVTALGEVYDRNALTCAHRFHPKGTLLKVTNLDNQKSVIARVNDRGPYNDEFIVDLSLAAASAIDLTLTGKAMVLVEPVGFSEEVSKPAPEAAPTASTFQSRSPNQYATRAPAATSAFNAAEVKKIPNGQSGYVIQVSAYSDYDNAANQIVSIQQRGVDFVYLLEEDRPQGRIYKVVLGVYNDRNFAEQYRERLKLQYQLNGIVTRLK